MMICCSALAFSEPVPPRPVARVGEVERGGTTVVFEPRIGTCEQEGLYGGRTSVPNSSMKRRHAPGSLCIGVSARPDEIDNDFPLAFGVPAHRTRNTVRSRVQRPGAPTVFDPNVRAVCHQSLCHLGVVTESCGVKGSIAFVDLNKPLGKEELVKSA